MSDWKFKRQRRRGLTRVVLFNDDDNVVVRMAASHREEDLTTI